MKAAHLIVLLALNVFWSSTFSIYKLLEPYLEPGGIVTLRFGLAGVALLALWPWLPGNVPRGRDLLKSCLIGFVIFVLGHRLQVHGNQLSTASNASILMAIEPLITSTAAAIFLREHIGPRRLLGFLLGIAGVALLNGIWRDDFKWVSLGASAIFVSSFVCETAFSIGGKPIITRAGPTQPRPLQGKEQTDGRTKSVPIGGGIRARFVGPLKFLTLSLLAATAANVLLDGHQTFTAAMHLPAQAWLLLLFMALICTSFGYGFWLLVIRESEVNLAALTVFSQPVCGVLIAKLWLGESLHWGQLWGSMAIVVGLVVGLSRQIKSSAT